MNPPIKKAWLDFRKNCIPSEASLIQVSEMEKAFYAGATSLFNTLLEKSEKEQKEAEREFDLVNDELTAYVEKLKKKAIHDVAKAQGFKVKH